ncbi:MAG: hypothetical protein HC836_43845 [Richelia sp. RM2_1_2]|nr:hypothetical protein [Richelia sp. SM1_7_0]NJN13251.1 hypothetical protein [Richelia sp. RM1_1_1]NJO64825.1 hypothetical protein [Richelia sp. RM2_1_2]
MPKFKERFYAQIIKWQDSGKSNTEVFANNYDKVCAYLWTYSAARAPAEITPEVKEFGDANFKSLGDANYNTMLGTRESCCFCGETYKLENLSICVDCVNLYCYRCSRSACGCGGELVG